MQEFVNVLLLELFKRPSFWIFMIVAILGSLFYKNIRGFMGEFWVKLELMKLSKSDYTVLNNIMLKSNNGTHQIDHIVISKFGIFVIETKNYYGLIKGSEYSKNWTQYLGKNKFQFYNPIHQNYGHIKVLEEFLEMTEENFVSIVCFSNQAKLSVKAKNVTQVDFLSRLIQSSYKLEIVKEDLQLIKTKIEANNITDRKIRNEHIKNIKLKIDDASEKSYSEKCLNENEVTISTEEMHYNECPQCGGKLVEKNGKYGKFIACSNYPKCRYTKSKLIKK